MWLVVTLLESAAALSLKNTYKLFGEKNISSYKVLLEHLIHHYVN